MTLLGERRLDVMELILLAGLYGKSPHSPRSVMAPRGLLRLIAARV